MNSCFLQAHEETCPDRLIVEMFMSAKSSTGEQQHSDGQEFEESTTATTTTVDDDNDWAVSVSSRYFYH
jgi:hypothetical protein